jgi:hypothetical protein
MDTHGGTVLQTVHAALFHIGFRPINTTTIYKKKKKNGVVLFFGGVKEVAQYDWGTCHKVDKKIFTYKKDDVSNE